MAPAANAGTARLIISSRQCAEELDQPATSDACEVYENGAAINGTLRKNFLNKEFLPTQEMRLPQKLIKTIPTTPHNLCGLSPAETFTVD